MNFHEEDRFLIRPLARKHSFGAIPVIATVILMNGGAVAQAQKALTVTSTTSFGFSQPYSRAAEQFQPLLVTGEPLFQLEREDERLVPWLIESYQTNDGGLTWSFVLRDGIKWSDDEPLNTDDIEFTFVNILTSSSFDSPLSVELRARVSSVSIVDDLEFIITLRSLDMRFPHRFLTARREGTFYVLPEHVWSGNIANFSSTPLGAGFLIPLLGSGPYVAESITATEATFSLNEDWWGATTGFLELPKPEQVVVRFFETDDEIVEALKSDEIDVGPEVSIETYQEILSENSNIVTWNEDTPISWPSQCPRQLDFNTIMAPWNDATLRKAVASFVDQSKIVAEVFEGQNYPSPTMFSAQPRLNPYIQAVIDAELSMSASADPAAGDALLSTAGYSKGPDDIYEKDGEDLTLTIHVADEPAQDKEVAIAIADMLTGAGIQTTVEAVPGDELWAWIMPPGDFEAVYSWLSCASMTDPFASMQRYHPDYAVDLGVRSPGYQNMARWNTESAVAYGQLVDQIEMLSPGDPAITDLVVEAYGHLAADTPFVPIVQNPRIIPFSTSRWTGWPTESNPYALPKLEWGQFNAIIHELEPK